MTAAAADPRHAVVTGCSSDIGAAVAARLLRDGWRVTGMSRSAPAAEHPAFTHRPVDLLDAAAIREAAEGLRPDALVHAAGVMAGASLGALDADAGRRL
jgi:NADP-dependent 3-hydroxy acid dehydrogenase YdfG